MPGMVLTEEQEELRRTVRDFLESKSPPSEVRRLMETEEGYSRAVWEQMAGQLGLQGLTVPERWGGAGLGYEELAIVLEEMGRVLLCAPYFGTVVLGVGTLVAAGDEEACAAYLPRIAGGDLIATLALAEDEGRWEEGGVALEARHSAGEWRLSGHKAYVLDGQTAQLVLVAARTTGGLSLLAVEGDADGMTRTALPTLDETRKLARLELSGTPARLIGKEGEAGPVVSRVLDLAAIGLAAEQVGGTQRCLDMSVEYAKLRYQFGRPIGSFQAIKHKCADMLLELESARSAARYAAWAAVEDSPEVPVVASLAKAVCSDAFFHAAAESIQIHGGIGFTWEHDAHLYFKRATSSQLFLGDVAYHRERLAQRIGV
ncbi:MAG: acyl-CoA dehydrogenase family protein [Candidatus Dormibacteraceae bacterium]